MVLTDGEVPDSFESDVWERTNGESRRTRAITPVERIASSRVFDSILFYSPPSLGRAKAGNPVRSAATPSKGIAEGAMPNSTKSNYSNLLSLRGMMAPVYQPVKRVDLEAEEYANKVVELLEIRDNYKWKWNAGAKYLFSHLIRAYGLDADSELVMNLANVASRPGRPKKDELAHVAVMLKQAGLSYALVAKQLRLRHGAKSATADNVRKLIKRFEPR